MARINDLSDRQIECLKLVAEGVTSSKAIAGRTGLSPSSVDNYLSRAAAILRVQGREAAAAAWIAHRSMHDNSVSQSVSRTRNLASLLKNRLSWVVTGVRWLLTVPPIGGRRHTLNRIEIILSILKVAVVSFTIFIVIVLVGAGLLWLL
jgi:DNA-binding CsgD family transcriptional regulator